MDAIVLAVPAAPAHQRPGASAAVGPFARGRRRARQACEASPSGAKAAPVKAGAEGGLRFAKVPPIVPVFVPAASQSRESACKLGTGSNWRRVPPSPPLRQKNANIYRWLNNKESRSPRISPHWRCCRGCFQLGFPAWLSLAWPRTAFAVANANSALCQKFSSAGARVRRLSLAAQAGDQTTGNVSCRRPAFRAAPRIVNAGGQGTVPQVAAAAQLVGDVAGLARSGLNGVGP
jgi:hypothetical protein